MNNYVSVFQNMELGQILDFTTVHRSAVIKSFHAFCEARNLDWKLQTWSDPPTPKDGKKCNHVWAMRIDGLSDREIEAKRFAYGFERDPVDIRVRKFIVKDPIQNMTTPSGRKNFGPTKVGWEQMRVGEKKIVVMHERDVKYFIERAIGLRGLWDWKFECERKAPGTRTEKRPTWLVTRIA